MSTSNQAVRDQFGLLATMILEKLSKGEPLSKAEAEHVTKCLHAGAEALAKDSTK
jgi:hypothetical protein